MKKLLLVGALALFASVNAQSGFKIGAHVGLPMGDAGDAYSFKAGADLAYMWPVADSFSAGIGVGYQAWFGKDRTITIPSMFPGMPAVTHTAKAETLSLAPIVATAEYRIAENFGIGADLGYGIMFAGGENTGGFYYQPKVSYSFGETSALWLGYQGLSKDGFNTTAINLGYTYSFNN